VSEPKNITLEQRFFKWREWNQDSTAILTFTDVEFVAAFGPFKQAERHKFLTIDYEEGVMYATAKDGSILKRCKFTLLPTPEGNEPVVLTAKEYAALQRDRLTLNLLREHGVDNWPGYGDALSEVDGEVELPESEP